MTSYDCICDSATLLLGGEKEKKADVGENVLVRSCQMFMTMI